MKHRKRVRRIWIVAGGPGGVGYWRPDLTDAQLAQRWHVVHEEKGDADSPNGYFLVEFPAMEVE